MECGAFAGSLQAANTTDNYTGPSNGSLSVATNWSLGTVPGVTNDAVFTATTGIRTLTASNLTVGSFDVTAATGTFSISNTTSTATNSVLTLGGAGDLGDAVSGSASADLLYNATGSTFNILGPNGNGTGVLSVVLGKSGNFDAAGTMAISAVISDGGSGFGITKTGAGMLTLSAANTFTGGVAVNNGTLAIGINNALASGVAVTVGTAASTTSSTFSVGTFSQSIASLQLYGGSSSSVLPSVTLGTGGVLTVNGNVAYEAAAGSADYPATISGTGALDLGGAVRTFNIYTQANPTGDLVISSIIQDGGITKAQTGVLTLAAPNTFTGATTISAGNVLLTNALALQYSTVTNNVASGVTFDSSVTGKAYTFGGLSGSTALVLKNNAGTAAAVALTVGANTATYSGVLSSTGSFTVNGVGTQTLSGANTYTGATKITAGTLQLGTGTGGGTTGSLSTSSAITDNGTFVINRSNSVAQGTDFSTAGITGTGGFSQIGSGTTTLTAANTFTGATTITAGALALTTTNALGGTASVTFSGTSAGSFSYVGVSGFILNPLATLTLNGTSNFDASGDPLTVAALTGVAGSGLSIGDFTTSTPTTYPGPFIVGSNNSSTTYAGAIVGTAASGTLFTKVGTGTLTLTGNNTFSGAVLISAGTLAASGAGTNQALGQATALTINSGGTLLLGAANQVNTVATISLNGGKLDAGGFAQGTSTTVGLGALTLAATSTIDLTGTSLLHFSASTTATAGTALSILDWSGTPITGNGAELIKFGTSATNTADLSYLSQISFLNPAGYAAGTYTAAFALSDPGEIVPGTLEVPEPTTVLGGALMLGVLGWSQRRRLGGLSNHQRDQLAA